MFFSNAWKWILLSLAVFTLVEANTNKTNPLKPVRLDHPRDTMQSFIEAMNDYRKGREAGSRELQHRIHDALRTMDLSSFPAVTRKDDGRAAAIFLKEVIDRVVVIKYDLIPDTTNTKWWRLKGTEIRIVRVRSGEKEGQFVFSSETVSSAENWYNRVKHLPYLEGSGNGAAYRETPIIKNIPDWAREKVFILANWQWIGMLFFIFLGFAAKQAIQWTMSFLARVSQHARFSFAHIVEKNLEQPLGWVAASLIWFLSLYVLNIEGTSLTILKFVTQMILYVSLIWVGYKFADALAGYFRYLASRTENTFDDQLVPIVSKSLRIFVVVFGSLIALQSFGVNVMSLLAGLGLGGLAFALAAKDTAANLFGSIMILFDRPFKVGDWIIADSMEGTVTEIGFRSTRIRTFYNSEVSIPNNILANANIDNMGRRQFRRAKALLGLTYDTPAEKIEAFCEGVKSIIQANPHTRKDYMHVCFHSFGDSSLNILVYFFLTVTDWADELVERQNIYLEILRLAEKLEVEFAFPTQTLHLQSTPDNPFTHPDFEIEALKQTAQSFTKSGDNAKTGGHGIFTPNHRQ